MTFACNFYGYVVMSLYTIGAILTVAVMGTLLIMGVITPSNIDISDFR